MKIVRLPSSRSEFDAVFHAATDHERKMILRALWRRIEKPESIRWVSISHQTKLQEMMGDDL